MVTDTVRGVSLFSLGEAQVHALPRVQGASAFHRHGCHGDRMLHRRREALVAFIRRMVYTVFVAFEDGFHCKGYVTPDLPESVTL
jgi:hypothetical protein